MDLDIHQMNLRSLEALALSILKSGLLRTTGRIPQKLINLTESKKTMLWFIMKLMLPLCSVPIILVHKMKHMKTSIMKWMKTIYMR